VVWLELEEPRDAAPGGNHPAVVLSHDRFNRSAISTVVVVLIISQLRYAALPGNVRLRKGEAGLPRPSVVNVTQIATIDRMAIRSRFGRLSRGRVAEIWHGVTLVLQPDETNTPV
jgi:mRNA interferase MazF